MKFIDKIAEAFVSMVKGASDIMTAIRNAVKDQVKGTLEDVKEVTSTSVDSVTDVVAGSIKGKELHICC